MINAIITNYCKSLNNRFYDKEKKVANRIVLDL